MSMLRASSAVRFRGIDNGNGVPAKGMGERSVSLPSLVPGKAYPGAAAEKPLQRKTPSELLVERRDFGVADKSAPKPQITGFLDLSQYSNYTNSVVPVDSPLFSVHPPVITFSDFEGLQTYEATITLRNQDNVARRVKVYPPNSPFFDLAAGRGHGRSKKASGTSGPGDKVAPGMEVSYVIRFKPDARIDYSHDLVVITEREKFSVPIRASGGSALLDFPDELNFGSDCVVGHQTQKTVLVRNIGDRATKFVLRTSPPFSIAHPDGYLPEGEACQVDIQFQPDKADSFERELHLKYGNLEAVAMLYGSATNADVSLSHSLLVIEDTYVGLETQGVVIISNNSDVPVDFSWRLFRTKEDEDDYRLHLQGQLHHEEREEMLYMKQDKPEESSDESGSDEERLKVRREAKITSTLSRKYGNITKAVKEDPMLFHDATFSIEPLVGRVWSHSTLMCACSFRPKDALVYSSCAYLECVGQEERAPLVLKGLGIGPKASFSYDELDVNTVFVESAHRYEVQLLNQGDIEVDFRLVPRDTKFGERFHFEPSSGTIAVGGQCEITVSFKPTELGHFHEVFDWVLKGSAIGVTLAFKGTSIQPSFDFDVERINFGIVSYGFLNSRMLTLSNTAEVPMRYTLRIIGDETPPEFDIVPGHGTLLPNCSQRVQVDFVSNNEKRYDLSLAVDLEGVGKELKMIPVTATCAAPQVTFEPHGCLSYGDVFIRYPFHQSLYLHNTSNLPAKFEVMPQEDKSRAEFEPDQWTGSVPPCASHVITVTLTAHMPGPVRVPMYVRIPGRAVPFPLVLVANSIGPRVIVDPPMLDWGQVKCLESVVRHVRLTNNSCIDASVRAFMNERKSLWSVHPKIIHLSPQETLQLAVTLKIDEASNAQDTLNLIVQESTPLTVQVKGRGIDTPVVCDDQLELIDFETLFTTHTEPRDVIIKNWGTCARRITWFREKEKTDKGKDAKKGKDVDAPPPIFRVEPENVVMDPKSAYRFTFLAMSPHPGYVEETIVCNETLDKGGGPGKPIFRPTLKATFVAPQLTLSATELAFKFFWNRDTPVAPMQETLVLTNTGPLEVGFRVQVGHPSTFSVDPEEGCIPPHGSQQLVVEFDPNYKSDRKSGVMRSKLTVNYDEHPAVNTVDLKGTVVWPNLDIDKDNVQFGIILNETTRTEEVELKNPTPLTVSYNWCLSAVGRNPGDSRTGASQASAWTRGTAQSQLAEGGDNASEDAGSTMGQTFGPASTMGQTFGGGADQDVNQIFDILPIFGQIPPYGTQRATITYYGLRDRIFKATATCIVEGGPEYELNVRGEARPCKFALDKYDLDFGDIPFTELGENVLTLVNQGKVPASFNFNSLGQVRNVVEISPSTGVMEAGEKKKIAVRFRAGIPDQVQETVLVEVAHFEPQKLTVKGNGTFPGIVIGLPRQNIEEHRQQLADARVRMSGRSDATGALAVTDAAEQPEGVAAGAATGGGEAAGALATTGPMGAAATLQGSAASLAATGATSAAAATLPTPSGAAADAGDGSAAEPISPRSGVSDDGQSVATRRTVQAKPQPSQEELDLELEVDRYFLCEVLLRSPGSGRGGGMTDQSSPARTMRSTPTAARSTGMGARGNKAQPLQVTAATYACDFGHVSLGNTAKKQIGVYNCCSEPVYITIDKRLLREYGFLVEPENITKLPPRQMTNLSVSATRPSLEEGPVELEWNLPVRGGPNYKIQLDVDWVLPDLVMSSDALDFGRLLVGQKKRITMEIRNDKAVEVRWEYVEPKSRAARGAKEAPIFELNPSSGCLQPGARQYIVASFTPRAAQQYNSTLSVRMKDNAKRKTIQVTGRGDVLGLEITPDYSYALGPVMPKGIGDPTRESCFREFKIVNPTDYPIEVYSVDFDDAYVEEERILSEYDEYETGSAEMKVRQPGDQTWERVMHRNEQLQKRKEREEARARGEEVPDEEQVEEPLYKEAPDDEALDESLYPYRVPNGSRVNALVVGPPKGGVSTMARQLASLDQRRALQIDEVFDWALQQPRFLHYDWKARKIVEAVNGGRLPTASETAHLLKRRVELADCNAGVIIDGTTSKYLKPVEVVEAVLEGLASEKLIVIGISLPAVDNPPDGVVNPDATVSVPADPADDPPHPYAAAAEVLNTHYEAVRAAAPEYLNELKASLPGLESAHTTATEAKAAAEADEENPIQPAQREALEADIKTTKLALQRAQEEIAACEPFLAWTPENAAEMFPQPPPPEPVDGVPVDPPPPLPPTVIIAEGYSQQFDQVQAAVELYNTTVMQQEEDRLRDIDRRRRAKKAAAKEAARPRGRSGKAQPPVELLTPPGPPPGMENWENPVDWYVQDFKALQAVQAQLAEEAQNAEEGSSPQKKSVFELLAEASRELVPMPLVPEEKPLPASTVVQVIERPAERPERDPLPNFSILTPIPPTQEAIEEYNAALAAHQAAIEAATESEEPEYPKDTDLTDRTRWIVDPMDSITLKVHFCAEEVATYATNLSFEIVGDIATGPVSINVSGISALPGITSNPRMMFPKCRNQRPKEGGLAVRTFVTGVKPEEKDLGTYDFGPLLGGREVTARLPVPVQVEEEDPAVDPDVTQKLPDPAAEDPAEPLEVLPPVMIPPSVHVMRHMVEVRITNDSLFESNVTFVLASNPDADPAQPAAESTVPFVVEPSNLVLPMGESQTIKVWCFPPDKGTFEERLIANIEHNPEPVTFGLCALGSVPWASLDVESVCFGRWMERIRADDQFVRLKNESALPVRWQLICRESEVIDAEPPVVPEGQEPPPPAPKAAPKAGAKGKAPEGGEEEEEVPPPQVPDEFSIDGFTSTPSGTLAAGEERNMRFSFRALKAAQYNFAMGLEVQDAENFRDWQDAGRVEVKSETFAVKVAVDPDPLENILDFSTVLVGSSVTKEFAVVNKGLYPVKYVLNTRGRALGELLTLDAPGGAKEEPKDGTGELVPRQGPKAEGELPPGESRTIQVKCSPKKLFETSGDRDGIVLKIFDIQSGEQVNQNFPIIRVAVTAVYNSFQVTPPRGVNFGPVPYDETRKMSFILRNVGLFGYDWCLFDPSNPPCYGEGPDGSGAPPKITDSEVKIGPFIVKPISGRLEQDQPQEIEVNFTAVGDQDFDCKLGLWVDGVQGEELGAAAMTRSRGFDPAPTLAAKAVPGSVIAPTTTYILTSQSCIPGINTTDLQTVFEEQFFARTLEDAVAIAGRPDVRVFCEVDKIFNFGPVLAHGGNQDGSASTPASPGGQSAHPDALEASEGVVERFRLTNPKSIPCKVNLEIKKRGGGAGGDPKKGGAPGGGDEDVFRLSQQQVTIHAHDSQQIEVFFKPPRLATFSAEFVATVEGGTDDATNSLGFELRGDGAVPSVTLVGPPLFGDDGGELHMGKLSLGRSHEVKLGLRNDGLLSATVRVEPSPSPHFRTQCNGSVPLSRGETHEFTVRFQPREVGPQFGYLAIRTLGNPFEEVNIKLCGEGYSDEVAWDLTEIQTMAETRKRERGLDPSPTELNLPPDPDHLDLGEVAIGNEIQYRFNLANGANQMLRFEFPEDMVAPFGEQLVIRPRTGFVEPNSHTELAVVFKPTEKFKAEPAVDVVCQTFAVKLEEKKASVEDGSAAGDEAGDGAESEQPFTEIDGTRKEVPLKISAVTDELALSMKLADGARGERTDLTEIHFPPTMMFATRPFRFLLENNSEIGAACELRAQGKTASSFAVTPSRCVVPANGDKEIEVSFSPKEVEHFDCKLVRTLTGAPESAAVVDMPLRGSAMRPWCHIELPESDYANRRQAETPLDPKCRIIEIVSLGTHVKNTKRFYVTNPTSETLQFEWKHMPSRVDSGEDNAFRCLSKQGEIRPNKKFEMVFEFAPLTTETKESFWSFMLLAQKEEVHFLVVGQVEEPRVGMDKPALNFGERLIDGETSEKVRLVNKEIIPFSFAFDPASYQQEGQAQVISVTPTSGVIGPDGSLDVVVTFNPVMERAFNFNVVCNVKRKKEPVVLNVKGIGYKIHASLSVEESADSVRRMLNPGVAEFLDFGVLQVQESRTFKLYLKNDSKRNFNFRVLMQSGPHRRAQPITSSDKPPYLTIGHNTEGVAERGQEAEIEIKYEPRDVHSLDGSVLQIMIPAGTKDEGFKVQLAGGAKRSRVEFSFYEYNFGPCFIARAGATMAGEPLQNDEESKYDRVNLIATNRDDQDVLLSTAFQREPHLDVQMDDTMIPAGGSLAIPITFSPPAEKEYNDIIEFLVNEYTRMNVKIRGRGCPMRLELTDLQMQNIDFGVTTGGKSVAKNARLVNRSARPITFRLCDEEDALRSKGVNWAPAHQTTLRPRETMDVQLQFTPMYKTPPFRLPLIAKLDNGSDIRLMQIAGTCHATEVRLSEHSVFFGDVVVDSQSSRLVKLHNFGDLGSKFRFEMPQRYSGVFSISPSDGFVRPQEEIPLTLAFHPSFERVKEFRRGERAAAARRGKQAEMSGDFNITVKDIRCVLDGHAPLMLEASGRCVSQPRESQTLDFVGEVRTKSENYIKIKHTDPAGAEWKLKPQCLTSEPAGASYWSCPHEITVKPGQEETVAITYMPLTMTEPEDGAPESPSGTRKREKKHKGTLFIGTPDGKALLYSLEGIATAPKCDQRLEAREPCKKQYTQKVPVKNWLQERQRFDAKVELIDPPPGSKEAQGFSIHAVGTLDLPAGLERDYKFNIYAYKESTAQVKVTLVSQSTGEYVVVDCTIQFYAADSLGTIHLEAACRQKATHKIAVANPLDTVARFKGVSLTNPDIFFSHDQLEVPPHSERTMELIFLPVEEGHGEGQNAAKVELQSEELGVYPYTVSWVATPAGLDRTVVLKAPLGGSIVEDYKFTHYAHKQVTYSAKVESVPGYQGSLADFQIEAGQDLSRGPVSQAGQGSDVSLAVRFRPSMLGESRAMLVVHGDGGGDYKALLTGFAQPPQPQGPISVPNGKGDGKVEFRNPFDKPTLFKFQIDNPAFQVSQREKMLDPGAVENISVFFKSERVQGGRLIISTDKVSTPWIFFLKGEM